MTPSFPEAVQHKLADFAAHARASWHALMRHPFRFKKQRAYREKQMILHALSKDVIALPAGGEVDSDVLRLCAIHIHAFYPDLLDEIVSTTGPLTRANVHFEVTVTNPDSVAFAEDLLRAKGCLSATVVLVPNRGRDLGPLFTVCKHLFQNYKYVAHLHTKRSYHLTCGDDWRRYLVRNVVGSDDVLWRQIRYFEKHPTCGVLYPENFAAIRKGVLSQENTLRTQELLTCLNPEWIYELRDFPAGSMCWLRVAAFLSVLDRLPQIEEYDEELGQVDGTLAHALERCLTLIPNYVGYRALAFRGGA